jgi:hypothetical protein
MQIHPLRFCHQNLRAYIEEKCVKFDVLEAKNYSLEFNV